MLNPEEETIRKQRAEFMREKVAMLKGRYRKLIELRYFEEYSYEEIAQELAIPLGTVKAQLFRARELLLNILQNSEIARENEKSLAFYFFLYSFAWEYKGRAKIKAMCLSRV